MTGVVAENRMQLHMYLVQYEDYGRDEDGEARARGRSAQRRRHQTRRPHGSQGNVGCGRELIQIRAGLQSRSHVAPVPQLRQQQSVPEQNGVHRFVREEGGELLQLRRRTKQRDIFLSFLE